MRIACVHVPQFALQSLTRIDPSLRGAPVAVVGAGFEPAAGAPASLALHRPIVLACSRAAWTLGVRLGMTATAARFASSELRVVAADAALERETVRAIADALLGVSAVVDCGGRVAAGGAHLAMYCEVPARTRGTKFGDRLLDLLDTLGLAARIGIADDRFTAWVAAADPSRTDRFRSAAKQGAKSPCGEGPPCGNGGGQAVPGAAATQGAEPCGDPAVPRDPGGAPKAWGEHGVVVVPRGGSAAFLAPRPLSLLAITPEVQHMLEALGVRTLGEFAELPAPSVSRPLEADYQALARGESGSTLRPYAPEAPIREDLVVGSAGSLFGGAAAVSALAERIAARLAGRARGAARLEVTVVGKTGEHAVAVAADGVASTEDELVALIAPLIGQAASPGTRLRVMVVGEEVVSAVAGDDEAAVPSAAAVSRADSSVLQPPLGEVGPPAPNAGTPWQLSATNALRPDAREAHRRTRRARSPRRAVTLAQSQLFGNLDRSG